jgi:hypothetical protein
VLVRIIQPGQGLRRNVLLGTYTQASITEMARDLGPATTVLQIDTLPEGHAPMTRAQLLEKVRTLGADEIGEVALIGWSAGCHGVRDHLGSLAPEVVVPLDGTHGSIPQPGSMPLAPWRDAVARARRGELLLVVSHTYLTYTDHLPAGQAFMSTAHVMRELTGWDLTEPTDPMVPAVKRDGGLIVYSWQSGDVDGAAHVRQVTHAGPLLVRDWLAPRWLGDAAPPVSAETLAGLAASAAEAPPDTEPQPATRRTTDAPAGQQSGFAHGYRCSVAELVADAIALGTWRPRSSGYQPRNGDLIISARSGEEPEHGGRGHVEIVTAAESGHDPTTLGGNEGNTWTVDVYRLANPQYRGAIERGALGVAALAVALQELRANVRETYGPNATARISEYHAGARRGGSHVAGMPGHESEGTSTLGAHASDEVAWCASAASFCAYQAAKG